MKRFKLAGVWLLCICLASKLGCVPASQNQEVLFEVRVMIDGHPTPEVCVALRAYGRTGEPSFMGVTDSTGKAGMMMVEGAVPLADGADYSLSVESLGNWQLAGPWADPAKTPLVFTWPPRQEMVIELPRKAIRRL